MQKIKLWPWHVLLFSIYPLTALFVHNLLEVSWNVFWKPLGLVVTGGFILYGLTYLVIRDRQRAAVATSFFTILFYSYGHMYSVLKGWRIGDVFPIRHRTLAPLWILLAITSLWWLIRKKTPANTLTAALNIVGAGLFILPLSQIISFTAAQRFSPQPVASYGMEVPSNLRELPDIYYIILDSYTRADILAKDFHYDNTEFLRSLESMGFYVAQCSQSNYPRTRMSLASSLNYTYLEDLINSGQPELPPYESLPNYIRDSATRKFLTAIGYQVVAFETGFHTTEIRDADVYLAPHRFNLSFLPFSFTEFDLLFAQTTGLRLITDNPAFQVENDYASLMRQRTTFTLTMLPTLAKRQGPKFVFAHLLIPHPPYVFGPNGESVTIIDPDSDEEYIRAYTAQVTYANKQMVEILSNLITSSPTPPIIIVQGDHGAPRALPAERLAILNAYYLPGTQDTLLYPSISPVNTFRVILNAYFRQQLPLLPDRGFAVHEDTPTYDDLVEIPNPCSVE